MAAVLRGKEDPTKKVASAAKACGDTQKKRHADLEREKQLAWRS